MTNFIIIAATVFGALIGSFLNVVVWRLPRGESLSHPASHCPNCNKPIRALDNIPIVSWLVLKAKCRDCGVPISARYPLVELGTAIVFGLVAWWVTSRFGSVESALLAVVLLLVAFLYLAAISIALAIIDLETHTLPNKIVVPAYLVGAVILTAAALVAGEPQRLATAAIGMAALFAAYFVMAIAYPGGMGFGDVKLAGALGMYLGWLGWGTLAVGAFAPFLLGGIFALALVLVRKAGRKSRIPFGPWMILGSWVGIVVGEPVASWYLGLFGLR